MLRHDAGAVGIAERLLTMQQWQEGRAQIVWHGRGLEHGDFLENRPHRGGDLEAPGPAQARGAMRRQRETHGFGQHAHLAGGEDARDDADFRLQDVIGAVQHALLEELQPVIAFTAGDQDAAAFFAQAGWAIIVVAC